MHYPQENMICHNLIIPTKLHFSLYEQLVNRTINNNYMTLSMALHHHAHDGFWCFLDASSATLIPGTLPTLNLPSLEEAIFYQGSCVFPDVILVSNYHSCKEKTIKLRPYHSFCGGHILHQEILSPLLWQCTSKSTGRHTKPPGCPFAFSSIPLINFKLHLSWSLQHSTLNMCGYYFFFAEYKLVK